MQDRFSKTEERLATCRFLSQEFEVHRLVVTHSQEKNSVLELDYPRSANCFIFYSKHLPVCDLHRLQLGFPRQNSVMIVTVHIICIYMINAFFQESSSRFWCDTLLRSYNIYI